jgi:NADPH:quinone reductase-like Zn-dependent oxidoreductase
MKAAVLHAFKTPLIVEDVPRPSLAPDDILIAVKTLRAQRRVKILCEGRVLIL